MLIRLAICDWKFVAATAIVIDMEFETIVAGSLAGSLGGLVVAIFETWRTSVQTRRTARLNCLIRQLGEVYGPIHYYCQIANEYFRHIDELNKVAEEVYSDPESPHFHRPDTERSEEIRQSIDVSNQYVERVRENNKSIVATLTKHWDLVEPGDMEIFQRHALNVARQELEFPGGQWAIPFSVRLRLPPSSFLHSEFSSAVRKRFSEITHEIAALQRPFFGCWNWIRQQVADLEGHADR